MIEFSKKGKKILYPDVLEFERKYGIKLPQDYIDFLIENNGGIPDKTFIELRLFDPNKNNLNHYIEIEKFFSLEEFAKVLNNVKNEIEDKDLFPIAEINGGMLLCIRYSDKEQGIVYYYDFDFGETKIGSLNFLLSILIKEHDVDYSKYGYDNILEISKEEEIVQANKILELEQMLISGYNTDKIIDSNGRRIIEYAIIQGNLEMVKLLHKYGSKFYNSLELAKTNLEFFPGEGYEEIINYISSVSE